MGVTEILARFLVETGYDSVPKELVKKVKERITDTVGVALAGAREPAGQIGIALVKGWGGKPESTVFGGGFRTSVINAAFANGISAHTLDYDDTTNFPLCHYSAVLVPEILSLAERERAPGKKVIETYALAYEVGTRIGSGLGSTHFFRLGWHPPGTWAAMGAAVAAAKLLNLDVDQTRTAMGIVSSACGGIRKHYGTNTKPLHCGYSARNGIVAALLAQRGFTADKDVLDRDLDARPGTHKYFSFPVVFSGEGNYDLDKMLAGLGQSYQLATYPPTTKFHPGPASTGNFIDLVVDMMRRHDFKAEDVEKVEAWAVPHYIGGAAVFPNPTCGDEARYSLHYQLAAALLDGMVGIDQHRDERVRRADIQGMLKKIYLYERADVGLEIEKIGDIKRLGIAKVIIKLKDGRELTGEQEKTKGDQELPLQREDLIAKYQDCARRALTKRQVDRSIELIEDLENLDDVTELMKVLKGKPER